MTGVSYLVDGNGNMQAVILDLAKHRRLWEDIYDRLLVESRKDEPRETLEQVQRRLLRRSRRVKQNG